MHNYLELGRYFDLAYLLSIFRTSPQLVPGELGEGSDISHIGPEHVGFCGLALFGSLRLGNTGSGLEFDLATISSINLLGSVEA